jgi:hypothetical protein
MAKAPAPPAALFTKGIASRIHMPAQMAADIAHLLELGRTKPLEPADSTHAGELAETLRQLLRPRCGYGYRFKRSDGCTVDVDTPGETCAEHTEWPLPDGADLDPDRCPGVPLFGKGKVTWVAEGATVRLYGANYQATTSGGMVSMRCPYPRRSDGSPCALHATRPEDRCGWVEAADSDSCMEITALYGCPAHHAKRLTVATMNIRRSVPCPQCGAAPAHPCTGRPEAYNDHVHATRKKKTNRRVEDLLRAMDSSPMQGKFWELASFRVI